MDESADFNEQLKRSKKKIKKWKNTCKNCRIFFLNKFIPFGVVSILFTKMSMPDHQFIEWKKIQGATSTLTTFYLCLSNSLKHVKVTRYRYQKIVRISAPIVRIKQLPYNVNWQYYWYPELHHTPLKCFISSSN